MKVKLIFIAIIFFILESILLSDNQETTSDYRVKSADQAVSTAMSYTGFDKLLSSNKLKSSNISVFSEIAFDTTTTFAKKEINNHEVWSVHFYNVILDFERTTEEMEVKSPKDFEIIIDAITGNLLEIKAISSKKQYGIKRFDFLNRAALPDKRETEQYFSLPGRVPQIDFSSVLSKGYSLSANKISAVYIMYNDERVHTPKNDSLNSSFPVWVICLDDFPPFAGIFPGVEYANQRIIIDAMTGEVLLNYIDEEIKPGIDSIGVNNKNRNYNE